MKLTRYTLVLFLILSLLIFPACAGAGDSIHPQMFDQLSFLMGASRKTVLEELGITEADLTADIGDSYFLPAPVEYHGVSFRIRVFFDTAHDRLYNIDYVARLTEEEALIAQKVFAVANALTDGLGDAAKPSTGKTEPLAALTVAQLEEKLIGVKEDRINYWSGYSNSNSWSLGQLETGHMEQYQSMLYDLAVKLNRKNSENYNHAPELVLTLSLIPVQEGVYDLSLIYQLVFDSPNA